MWKVGERKVYKLTFPFYPLPHSLDGPLELPLFQLIPSQRQLVFRGDRLPLQCTASYLDESVELRWRYNGRIMSTQEDRGVYVEETLLHDCCLLTRYSGEKGGVKGEGEKKGIKADS